MTLEEIRKFGEENNLSIQVTLDYGEGIKFDVMDRVNHTMKRYSVKEFLIFAGRGSILEEVD